MRVCLREDGSVRMRGSLSTYVRGSNWTNLSFSEVQNAIDDLADTFDFVPKDAHIARLDWGATMEMPDHPGYYLRNLAHASAYQRLMVDNATVKYFNTTRALLFYDKGGKENIDGNWLRYEMQLGRINRVLKFDMSLADLRKPATMHQLTNRWIDEYDGIDKLCRPVLYPLTTPKELDRVLASAGLEYFGGEAELRQQINRLDLSRNQRYRLNKRVTVLSTTGQNETDLLQNRALDDAILDSAIPLANLE